MCKCGDELLSEWWEADGRFFVVLVGVARRGGLEGGWRRSGTRWRSARCFLINNLFIIGVAMSGGEPLAQSNARCVEAALRGCFRAMYCI